MQAGTSSKSGSSLTFSIGMTAGSCQGQFKALQSDYNKFVRSKLQVGVPLALQHPFSVSRMAVTSTSFVCRAEFGQLMAD